MSNVILPRDITKVYWYREGKNDEESWNMIGKIIGIMLIYLFHHKINALKLNLHGPLNYNTQDIFLKQEAGKKL